MPAPISPIAAKGSDGRWIPFLLLVAMAAPLPLPGGGVTVGVDKPGAQINPAMWGVFFEDINFGADGGLYAELVKNRSFDFPQALMGWNVPGESAATTRLSVLSEDKPGATRHFLRLESSGPGAALVNEGFRGMGIRAGEGYAFSTSIRGAPGLRLTVELTAPSGEVIASAELQGCGKEWTRANATLVGKGPGLRARLRLSFEGSGSAEMNFVSLFPVKTWKGRSGGLRADMGQALADLGPGLRGFPGG